MPLKDLATNTAELTERWVEEIVAPYVNYDVEDKRVILLPAASSLSSKKKVLIFLTALRGWPFLTEDAVKASATPAQIGEGLNIQGGTLRPVLKELKDANFVSANGREYAVSVAALPYIKEEVVRSVNESGSSQTAESTKGKSAKKSGKGSAKKTKSSIGAGGNTEFLNREITEGFFDDPKVISDVLNRFHETGRIVQKGVVSPLLLKAVKGEKLRRRKSEVNGRSMWMYETAK